MKSKYYFVMFILLVFAAFEAKSQTYVSGVVSGIWLKANSPYVVIGSIQVQENDTLKIEPGVQVLFDGGFSFQVNGHLCAVGTESDSILFSHHHPDSLWAGIYISKKGNKSILEYCRIEYSKFSGINIGDSSPTIRHCHILHNTDIGSKSKVGFGGGIDVSYADPLIEFNVIEYNSCERGGGIHIYEDPSSRPGVCRIFNNIIRKNTATWGGGIRVFSEGAATSGAKCTPIIRNNVFDGNSVADSLYGGNIYIFPGAKPQIINNIIINSPSGSGLLDLSNSIIKYNNVWNNKPYDYVNTTPGIGDISADPLFVEGSPYDYHLMPNSPSINAGDPDAPLDPDNTRADMGAFYFGMDQPPLPVSNLIAQPGNNRITLKWDNPNIIDYAYIRVIRNEFSFPQLPDDGIIIYEGIRNICQDTSLVNDQAYYYGVFVYDIGGFVSVPTHIAASPVAIQTSVIRVPWDYLKIQDALNAANPGDTVLVYPGRYSPSTNSEAFPIIMTDNVVLISKSGRDSTVIDAEQTNLVVLGANHSILQGFTITNGWNSKIWADKTGGSFGKASGGGILCRDITNMKILENTIENNNAYDERYWNSGSGGGSGGGIYCFNSKVDIIGNIIRDNRAGSDCGGIGYSNRSSPPRILIQDNLIIRNDAGNAGGISIGGVHAVIKNNVIAFNRVHVFGMPTPGGIYLSDFYWGSAEIINNTIAYNYNVDMPGNISGIYYSSGVNPITLKNNIVWGHREHEVAIGVTVSPSGVERFKVSYSCIEDGYQGIGNISDNPLFTDEKSFNFFLSENSPCIDAGDPNSSLDPDGTRADIGAKYFHHTETAILNLSNEKISICVDHGQDTSISLNIRNVGDWPLQIKMFGEAGSNTINVPKPSKHGYTWIDSDHPNGPRYDWIEIESIGTKITTKETIDLPFHFCFFDNYYASVDILYYGLLDFSFVYPYEDENKKIPYWTPPNNIAAVFWDNFARNGQQGVIYYYLDQQNERLIVQYKDMHRNANPTPSDPRETFEIILNKDGTLIYQYKDVSLTTSATVGIESMYGRDGIQIAYNEEYLHDNMAIKIFVGAPWIDVPLLFEKIGQNQSKDFKINVPASTLDAGTYDAFIVIESNDNKQATVKIPVYLNVNPSGGDQISPSRINDLSIKSISDSSVTLIWTATGDDSTTGIAAQYDIRFQTHAPSSDTTAWWEQGQKVINAPRPSAASKRDSLIVTGLSPDSTYYFALKIGDDANNWSEMSDIVSAIPVPVELISFEAKVIENSVSLIWCSATESHNWGFEVQRSDNKYEFRTIGFIKGQGTSVKPKIYQFEDRDLSVGAEYRYRLKQIDLNGSFSYSAIISVIIGLPETFSLSQNYPNPFNPETTIKYQLPDPSEVMIRIFNITGQVVKTILEEHQPAGYHSILWDGKDDLRSNVSSGVYFYQLFAKAAKVGQVYTETRKMVLVR